MFFWLLLQHFYVFVILDIVFTWMLIFFFNFVLCEMGIMVNLSFDILAIKISTKYSRYNVKLCNCGFFYIHYALSVFKFFFFDYEHIFILFIVQCILGEQLIFLMLANFYILTYILYTIRVIIQLHLVELVCTQLK